jgi:hypothetical protein
MESIRSIVRRKVEEKITNDKDIFVEEIFILLEPHLDKTVIEMQREIPSIPGDSDPEWNQDVSAFTAEAIHRLLDKFFILAKQDASLNKFMFPIMLYLRKARHDRRK